MFSMIFIATSAIIFTGCKKKLFFNIGDEYQGGIIFYIDDTDEHGLICAKANQANNITWFNGDDNPTYASGSGIGTGNTNTNTIVTAYGNGSYAAKICYDLEIDGYTDWYLPSKDELQLLFQNLGSSEIGNFGVCTDYWSSTEQIDTYNSPGAWCQTFNCAAANGNYRYTITSKANVRAIRAF